MIRRISTKWVLGVLAAVVVPFVGFAVFVDTKVSDRLAGDVVRYYLLSMSADLADRVDREIEERKLDAEILASNAMIDWFVSDTEGESGIFQGYVERTFDLLIERSGVYDYALAIDVDGRCAVSNRTRPDGRPLDEALLERVRTYDFGAEAWFRQAMSEGSAMIDWQRSPFDDARDAPHYIGFAQRIDPSGAHDGPVGVICLYMNWQHIQRMVSSFGGRVRTGEARSDPRNDAVGKDIYESCYAWIWSSDADTIIAHPDPSLYGARVSGPRVELPGLVAAARSSSWGMYPEYAFRGERKNAAFKRCRGPELGGFGWVVGVGIDNDDIYAPIDELSRVLYSASAVVLAVAVLWAAFVARRLTRPVLALQRHTRRIAGGDLDARIDVHAHDELGDLAESFNRMTAELKEKRAQLVQAEKDAAWREMARQVAHEIKNPLTPIRLSVGLLRRAHAEHSPDFDGILDRTIDLIQRQVDAMREIAADFYAFAGEHRVREPVDMGAVVDDVLALNAAWAEHQGVRVRRTGNGGAVLGDRDEVRRAIQNLVSNAIEAMPDGGELAADVQTSEDAVTLELRDTGVGLSEEIQSRLFEPYFTTRSGGTGLGLAIVRRVVEDMGGRLELRNAASGQGAVARVTLPRAPEGGSPVTT